MRKRFVAMMMTITIFATTMVGCAGSSASSETANDANTESAEKMASLVNGEETEMTIPEKIKNTIENGGDPTAAV